MIFRLGRSLRAKGLSEAAIVAALLAENAARCVPPLADEAVRATAKSAASKPPGPSGTVTNISDAPASGAVPQDADDDLARRFIAQRPLLRHVASWGKWLAWNGRLWEEDTTLAVFADIRRSLRAEAKRALEKRRRDLLSAKTVAAVERLARCDPAAAATPDQWDADDLLLNTPAGVVDLRTGKVGNHEPDRFCTKITAVGPAGECPRWRKFLHEVTDGDESLIAFLQRVSGYAATGLTVEHALFFFYGTGANGKGTFLNLLVWLLNDYATVAPMEVFTETHGERHPTELAMLRMVRLVVAQETEEGRRWAESRIKAMTGGDPITARFMRQDFFTFVPKFKLMIAGNHKPSLRNVDEAMRRRLHLIPFTVTIPKERRDQGLSEALKAEAGAILRWVIRGALEYQRIGLAPPVTVTAATESYFGDEDIFGQWLEDLCDLGPALSESAKALFTSWCRYAEQANVRPGNTKTFAGRLEAAGFVAGNSRARGGRFWAGIQLAPVGVQGGLQHEQHESRL